MDLLTPNQAAKYLSIHPETLRRYSVDGLISFEKTKGGHRRYKKEDVEALQKAIEVGKYLNKEELIQSSHLTIRETIRLAPPVQEVLPEKERFERAREEAVILLKDVLGLEVQPEQLSRSKFIPESLRKFLPKALLNLENKETNFKDVLPNNNIPLDIPFNEEDPELGVLQVYGDTINYHSNTFDNLYDIKSLGEIGAMIQNNYLLSGHALERDKKNLRFDLIATPIAFVLLVIFSFLFMHLHGPFIGLEETIKAFKSNDALGITLMFWTLAAVATLAGLFRIALSCWVLSCHRRGSKDFSCLKDYIFEEKLTPESLK